MDIFTHALASAAAARVILPKAPRLAWFAVILAGTIADADQLSAFVSPSAYLTWHRTCTHSIAAAVVFAAILTILYAVTTKNSASTSNASAVASASNATPHQSLSKLFLALQSLTLLHIALDACQSDPITPLWPFSARRIAANYLQEIDPYIIAVLLAGLLLPELLGLVSSEIGSKSKTPRGRNGAAISLAVLLIYVAARALLHSNAATAIHSRTYRNESPRRFAAYPDSTSLFTWHAIVETESALHEFNLNAIQGSAFDPQNTVVLFKPEPSPALDTARNSPAGKKFLATAQFPKATVQKTDEGYEVQLRDLRNTATSNTNHEVSAVIQADANGKLLDDSLVWTKDLQRSHSRQ
jgi:membrane-bound metal-dependent hydrolase YbcI (DUF457 family)